MVYPHGPDFKKDELSKIERSIRNQKKWVEGALSDIGAVLKFKKDIEYYMHLTARLEKRVDQLHQRLESLEFQKEVDNSKVQNSYTG